MMGSGGGGSRDGDIGDSVGEVGWLVVVVVVVMLGWVLLVVNTVS